MLEWCKDARMRTHRSIGGGALSLCVIVWPLTTCSFLLWWDLLTVPDSPAHITKAINRGADGVGGRGCGGGRGGWSSHISGGRVAHPSGDLSSYTWSSVRRTTSYVCVRARVCTHVMDPVTSRSGQPWPWRHGPWTSRHRPWSSDPL